MGGYIRLRIPPLAKILYSTLKISFVALALLRLQFSTKPDHSHNRNLDPNPDPLVINLHLHGLISAPIEFIENGVRFHVIRGHPEALECSVELSFVHPNLIVAEEHEDSLYDLPLGLGLGLGLRRARRLAS